MAVNVQFWTKDIVEQLFADNAFMSRSFDAGSDIVNGSIVHIPQAGSTDATLINNNAFPVTAVERSDNDIIYALDRFYRTPKRISDINKKELSYDYRASIIRTELQTLKQDVGTWLIYRWFNNVPNALTHRIMTTGAVGGGGLKRLTGDDIMQAQALQNKQNVPKDGRILLLDTDHEMQLRSDKDLAYAFQQVVDLKNGAIARLHGFDIYSRSQVATISAAGAVKVPNAAAAATDKAVSCFWHEMYVERAMGSIEIFDNPNRAEHYGDIVSFLIRNGGRHRREDLAGFGLIVPST